MRVQDARHHAASKVSPAVGGRTEGEGANKLFSLVDVARLVSGKTDANTRRHVRIVMTDFSEVSESVRNLNVALQGVGHEVTDPQDRSYPQSNPVAATTHLSDARALAGPLHWATEYCLSGYHATGYPLPTHQGPAPPTQQKHNASLG